MLCQQILSYNRFNNLFIQTINQIQIIMIVLPLLGFALIGSLNFYSFIKGYKNYLSGDKDILYPFASFIFFFFPLLIYLPQVHYKITNFQQDESLITPLQKAHQQDEAYPLAFLLALLSISIGVFIDKFLIKDTEENQIQEQNHLNVALQNNNNSIIKYFLTLSIGFLNIVNCFYITIQSKDSSIFNELFIFLLFSIIINFSFGKYFTYEGYLLAWAKTQYDLAVNLNIFVNIGLIIGWLLGIIVKQNILLLILMCLSAGLQIYTSIFICFQFIFSKGENSKQDKFRFGSIFTSLLLSIIYYPIVYLLRI